jgi:hypothetical protein
LHNCKRKFSRSLYRFYFIKNNFTLKQSFKMTFDGIWWSWTTKYTLYKPWKISFSGRDLKNLVLRKNLGYLKKTFYFIFVLFSICMHLFLVEVSVKNSQIVFFS